MFAAAATIPDTCVPWPSPSCGVLSSCDEVAAGDDPPGEVGVVELRARVDHGDHRAGARGGGVGGVGLDEVQVPLLAAARVLRGRGGGEEGQREEGDPDAPHG